MQTVSAMVSQSPQLMAELRRLHEFVARKGIALQMHHLPSALNLNADRFPPPRRNRVRVSCRRAVDIERPLCERLIRDLSDPPDAAAVQGARLVRLGFSDGRIGIITVEQRRYYVY